MVTGACFVSVDGNWGIFHFQLMVTGVCFVSVDGNWGMFCFS